MNNLRIMVYAGNPKALVDAAIMEVTHSDKTHTAIYVNGYTFDDTLWQLPGSKWWQLWTYRSGVRITKGLLPGAAMRFVPIVDLYQDGIDRAMGFLIGEVNSRRRYNFLLTLADYIIYPTRRFWNRIGWVPFSSRYMGHNCSYLVDVAVKLAGLDMWPKRKEATTVPGDYEKCKVLKLDSEVI